MQDCRLEIVPAWHDDIHCNSFVCEHGTGHKKYYIGNPYSGGLYNYPVYCSECIEHLISTIPPDLMPDGAALEARIRALLTQQYDSWLAEQLAAGMAQMREDADKYIAYKLADAESTFGVGVVEDIIPIEPIGEKMTFRCLDCGHDFETKEELNAHKPAHDVPAKNKGGRPPKAKQ